MPFTVVMAPLEAISTAPPSVANDVAPVESKVETLVSPVTSRVPATVVSPVPDATVNLSVAMSKSPSIPVSPVTSQSSI